MGTARHRARFPRRTASWARAPARSSAAAGAQRLLFQSPAPRLSASVAPARGSAPLSRELEPQSPAEARKNAAARNQDRDRRGGVRVRARPVHLGVPPPAVPDGFG